MMLQDGKLFIGTSRKPDDSPGDPQYLTLKFGNRHGLITGATGTGKTVTLQVLAEAFSNAGVPVFCADIKGDLSGIAAIGKPLDFLLARAAQIGLAPYDFQEFPAILWDIYGEKGHRVRATVAEMGPLLLSRLLSATDAQEGVLNIAFKIADEGGLPLLDFKDLQAMLAYMAENAATLSGQFGQVSKASVGSLQRELLILEQQGAENFFGEPALKITDIMRTTNDGRGAISVLAAEKLMMNPRLYATFLLWLLSELFEELPEVGDMDKPKLVFFFDEAHLLFNDAPKVLVERVEQVVRLIRSKGVGVYFVTQNPLDVPETVLAQLGNRVQHALRAYTPREQKGVKTAAETFRANPDFDSAEAITNLATGEALVSMLEGKGVPSVVQRTLIRPPSSRLGPLMDVERRELMAVSPVRGLYDTDVDRKSAYEILAARAAQATQAAQEATKQTEKPNNRWTLPGFGDEDQPAATGSRRAGQSAPRTSAPRTRAPSRERQTVVEAAVKSVVRAAGSQLGRALIRGILGSLRR